MKPGRKPETTASRAARGTLRGDRAAGQLKAPDGEVTPPPGSLTQHGLIAWDTLAPDAQKLGTLAPCDATLFAAFANLAAAVQLAFLNGAVPPAAYLAELRRLGEMFGLAGERSRVVAGLVGRAGKTVEVNPFASCGVRPDRSTR